MNSIIDIKKEQMEAVEKRRKIETQKKMLDGQVEQRHKVREDRIK